MILLRQSQASAVEAIRAAYASGKKAPLFVAPCGYGKTVLFSYMAHSAQAKGNTVVILAHRGELIDQISDTLSKFDVDHSFIAAGYQYRSWIKVQVASAQTLVRRVKDIEAPDLLIIDEAHHSTRTNTIGKIVAAWQ